MVMSRAYALQITDIFHVSVSTALWKDVNIIIKVLCALLVFRFVEFCVRLLGHTMEYYMFEKYKNVVTRF